MSLVKRGPTSAPGWTGDFQTAIPNSSFVLETPSNVLGQGVALSQIGKTGLCNLVVSSDGFNALTVLPMQLQGVPDGSLWVTGENNQIDMLPPGREGSVLSMVAANTPGYTALLTTPGDNLAYFVVLENAAGYPNAIDLSLLSSGWLVTSVVDGIVSLNTSSTPTFDVAAGGTGLTSVGFYPLHGNGTGSIISGPIDLVADVDAGALLLPANGGTGSTGSGFTDGYALVFDPSGTHFVTALIDLTPVYPLLTGQLPLAQGGTGASTASGARSNLHLAQSGVNSDITLLNTANSVVSLFTVPFTWTASATTISITFTGSPTITNSSNILIINKTSTGQPMGKPTWHATGTHQIQATLDATVAPTADTSCYAVLLTV